MSNASEAFSAKERIESGDWDDHLLSLWLAVNHRRKMLNERREEVRSDEQEGG